MQMSEQQAEYETKQDIGLPVWNEIPDQIKRAMSAILIYMQHNSLKAYHISDDGKNGFIKRRTQEELLEIQEANRIAREAFETDFPKRPEMGHIYLVASETGHYKIGRAQKLDQRIQQFGVKIPFKTWLAHSFVSDDYKNAEKLLHEKYSAKRSHGEWFVLSDDDVKEICAIQDGQL